MRFQYILSLALLLAEAVPLTAQQSSVPLSQTLKISGTTVEVIGLKKWNLKMLQDSLKKHDISLTSGMCAATMRYSLGFADAAVIGIKSEYRLVTLTEPQDSSHIRYRPMPFDTTPGRAEWSEMEHLAKVFPEQFVLAVAKYPAYKDSAISALPPDLRKDSTAIRKLWNFIRAHNTPSDEKAAIMALKSASQVADRRTAMAIAMNFPESDSVWAAVASGMIETDGPIKLLAADAIRGFIAAGHRPSSWEAIAPTVSAILNGTSQFMIFEAMDLVESIKPDSVLSKSLLKDGGSLLLAYASLQRPRYRERALTTLRTLSGKDFGADVSKWQAWVASL